jgi:4-amino-4-deoxychorismate lyase
MSLLFETISIRNGVPEYLDWHQKRMNFAMQKLFKVNSFIDLAALLVIPSEAVAGHFRCRVEYDTIVRSVSFRKYEPKQINSLKLVEDNTIIYNHKYADRSQLDQLHAQRGDCDDVLIIKNGLLTDTSYANIIFRNGNRWETPDTPLLNGTCRSRLLASGIISEIRITPSDLKKYSEFQLINALRGMNAGGALPVNRIVF